MRDNHVVIVDDDEIVLDALSRCVEKAGFTTSSYDLARDALEQIAEDDPVAIVSDYMMPEMDGITFLQEARRRAPAAARILCTAVDDLAEAMQVVNSGDIHRLVSKPWRFAKLVAAVTEAAEAALLRQANERLTRHSPLQNPQLRAVGP